MSQWFLWAVFVCSVITLFFKHRPLLAAAVCIALLFLPDSYNAFRTHLWKFMLPYFLIGFYWHEYDGMKHLGNLLHRFRWIILALLAALWLLLLPYYLPESLVYYSGVWLLNGYPLQWLIDIYRYGIGLIGSLLFIWTGYLFFRGSSRLVQLFAACGRASIWIYFFSNLLNYALLVFFEHFSPHPLLPIVQTIAITALCLITYPLLRRIPFIGKWILGGR